MYVLPSGVINDDDDREYIGIGIQINGATMHKLPMISLV